MNLRWGKGQQAAGEAPEAENTVHCMTALVEGVAEAMPRIDAATYSSFRGTAARMALQIPDSMDNAERMKVVNAILHEFENYRLGVENALRERQKNWRSLTIKLTGELLKALGVKPDSAQALPLTEGIDMLMTGEQLREYRELLDSFLDLRGAGEAGGQDFGAEGGRYLDGQRQCGRADGRRRGGRASAQGDGAGLEPALWPSSASIAWRWSASALAPRRSRIA